MSRLSPNFTASPRARKKSRASEGVLLPEQTMSGCTSRQRRRYRFAPSAFSPRKPTPRRLRWTRRRTRLIPAGRKVFMRLKPSPNIVSSAPSSSPSADSRKTIRYRSRRAGPAKTSTPPCGLGRAPPDGTGVSSRRKAGSGERTPLRFSERDLGKLCEQFGDHFPSNRSASNVPTALSAYHAFSFAISFSFAAAHRPFSPLQHSRPETIRQYTKLSVFKTKKEMRILPF